MTRDKNHGPSEDTVRLSIRDWFGILACVMTVMSMFIGSYLHHDRMLTEVLTRQQTIVDRVERIENSLDK